MANEQPLEKAGSNFRSHILQHGQTFTKVFREACMTKFGHHKIPDLIKAAGFSLEDVLKYHVLPRLRSSVTSACQAGENLKEQGFGDKDHPQGMFCAATKAGFTDEEATELVKCLTGDSQSCEL